MFDIRRKSMLAWAAYFSMGSRTELPHSVHEPS